ncbi:hypothetical protein KHP57_04830 [Algiphilus sp. NNCM1]|nr:hypothetical protein [Algiphilus acroporae]
MNDDQELLDCLAELGIEPGRCVRRSELAEAIGWIERQRTKPIAQFDDLQQ